MNQPTALELADEFRDLHMGWVLFQYRNWGMDAQITLRKQTKEIENLEKALKTALLILKKASEK